MRPGLVMLLLLMSLRGWGQGISWEKRLGWRGSDYLTDVVDVDGFSVIAVGSSASWGYRDPFGDRWSNVMLLKYSVFGDSIWMRPLDVLSRQTKLVKGDSGRLHVLCNSDTGSLAFNFLTVDYEGQVLSHRQFPNPQQFYVQRAIRARSGLIYACGHSGSETPGNLEDMVVVCLDPETGLMVWQQRYSDNPYTRGGWIEETPRHTFLASGHAGSRIWAIEIDSSGNELQRQTLYQTPSLLILDEYSNVQQMPGGGYVLSAGTISSPHPFYFGLHADLSQGSQVWGKEQTGSCLPAHVNLDGSIVLFANVNLTRQLIKFKSDSSIVWQVPVTSSLGSNSLSLKAFSYNSDSSVIAVGSIFYQTDQDNDFYLCRIKNVGIPYDPAHPVATKPHYRGLPPLIAYPNPSSGQVTVHTRARQPLAVYSLSGQKLLEHQADPSGTTVLDLAGLPKGMYLLRQGENSIKLIKH